tara:strand:+ start:5070 stop:5237 length:168 start_codon:yes stop_codon:yes gene_type:complete
MNDLLSQDKFEEYVSVQEGGLYNMFDPNARAMTNLSKDEWVHIISNYNAYSEAYS